MTENFVEAMGFSVFNFMKTKTNHVGEKFGRITILEHLEKRNVRYKCDCGSEKIGNLSDIKRGRLKGCGCQRNLPEQRENARERVNKMREEGIFMTGRESFNKINKYPGKQTHPMSYMWRTINKPRINKEKTKHKVLISKEDLETLWELQGGICIYSKIKLVLPQQNNRKDFPQYVFASVDRIDSSKDYTVDNIQFVSRTINFAKNSISDKDFVEFLRILSVNLHV